MCGDIKNKWRQLETFKKVLISETILFFAVLLFLLIYMFLRIPNNFPRSGYLIISIGLIFISFFTSFIFLPLIAGLFSKNKKIKTSLIIIGLIIIILMVYFVFFSRPLCCLPENLTPNYINNFNYGEIIKSKIGSDGGVIKNKDESVIVNIPSNAVDKEIDFVLSFRKSNFDVKSGTGSPITISIYPDINLMDSLTPINIKIKYDAKYNLPVGYLIDENNKLHSVNFGVTDRDNNYFTIWTFHGGNYSWIYAN